MLPPQPEDGLDHRRRRVTVTLHILRRDPNYINRRFHVDELGADLRCQPPPVFAPPDFMHIDVAIESYRPLGRRTERNHSFWLRHLNDPPNKGLYGWPDYHGHFTLILLRGTESHPIREAHATTITLRGTNLHLTNRDNVLCLYTVRGWIVRPSVPQGPAGLPTNVAVPCMAVDDACPDRNQYISVAVGPVPRSGETHYQLLPTPASCP